MCRMLVVRAPTIKLAREVLTSFRKQASVTEEEVARGKRDHRDGWGLVAFSPDDVRYLARRAEDAATDAFFDRAMDAIKTVPKDAGLMCHIRRGSRGDVRLENTHPFVDSGWAFCHNGTITGPLDEPGVEYVGQTDSERFFRKLLKHLRVQPTVEDALRRCVSEMQAHGTFTSLTCVFTDGATLYGYRRVGADPEGKRSMEDLLAYHMLGIGRIGKATVVAQELDHLGAVEDWQEVPDDGLLVWKRGRPPEIKPLGMISTATPA